MAYGWSTNEPVIKPLEEGGDNINQYAQKIKNALDALYVELRQDIVRATLAESIAATDINKIITPSTAFRTYYGTGEPSNLQGKNNDTYIRYGDVKDTYIKVSGSWQKIDAVPQPATLAEVSAGTVTTKYVTPQTMNQNNKSDLPGGFPRLDENGLLPRQYIPTRMAIFDTAGTHSWLCPVGVTKVIASGCAGGGGGGGGSTEDSAITGAGGSGGYGGQCIEYVINVTAGNTYAITIGTGGTGGAAGANGQAGGATIFGSLLNLGGGAAGAVGRPESGGANGANGSSFSIGYGTFGTAGAGRTTHGVGNTGSGYGSPGSGGYGHSSARYAGGAGRSGFLILKWVQ